MGMASRLPVITREPCWFQSAICWEMTGSWLIRAWMFRGPKTSFCFGNW